MKFQLFISDDRVRVYASQYTTFIFVDYWCVFADTAVRVSCLNTVSKRSVLSTYRTDLSFLSGFFHGVCLVYVADRQYLHSLISSTLVTMYPFGAFNFALSSLSASTSIRFSMVEFFMTFLAYTLYFLGTTFVFNIVFRSFVVLC